MIEFFSKLKDNRIFQFSVVIIIILNAILIGATTYQLDPLFLNTIHLLDYAITVFFVIEILIRFIGEKEKKKFGIPIFKRHLEKQTSSAVVSLVIILSSATRSARGNRAMIMDITVAWTGELHTISVRSVENVSALQPRS